MKRNLKISLCIILALSLMFILVGCGAVVSTNMEVDVGFKGTREIKVEIENEDINSYVTGGAPALEKLITDNLPSEMTYSASTTDNAVVYTFVISFDSLDDYRTKVNNLVDAGSNEELVPEIIYEKHETVFKSGMKFEENFTSFDLIQWYYDVVAASGIVTSTDDWYEMGDDVLFIEGVEYDTYGHKFEVDNQESYCLSSGEVKTEFLSDGTFKRTITLVADEDVLEDLKENKDCDLNDYFSKLSVEGVNYENSTNDYNDTEYKFTFVSSSLEDLNAKTNAIMQSEACSISYRVEANSDELGKAKLFITETIDGSYYFDYSYFNPVDSFIIPFENATISNSNISTYDKDSGFFYNPSSTGVNEFELDWLINYEDVELEVFSSKKDKATVEISFITNESMDEEIKNIAVAALETAMKDMGEVKSTDNKHTVSFSGAIKEVEVDINNFIGKYEEDYIPYEVDNIEDDGTFPYFDLEIHELETPSKFTQGVVGGVNIDFTPIIGKTNITLSTSNHFFAKSEYIEGYDEDEEGNYSISSTGAVAFYTEKPTFLFWIILVISVVLIITGIVLAIVKRNDFKELFAKKEKVIDVLATDGTSALPINVKSEDMKQLETVGASVSLEQTTTEASAEIEEEEII